MDPLGNNKVFAAILGGALVFMMIRMLPEVFMHHEAPKVPAYIIGEMEDTSKEEVIELPFPQAEWVSAMDAERGAKVFKSCASCHNVDDGGPNGTGPGLWNVVGAGKGVHAGYTYSAAMASTGTNWTYETLDGFLEKPKKYLPGTKMNFVGIRKESDRAAVIEYLRLASSSPLPRPEPAAAAVEMTVEAEAAEVIPSEEISEAQPTIDPTETNVDTIVEDALDIDEVEVTTPDATDEVE